MIGQRDYQIVWLAGGLFLALTTVFFAAVWRHGFRWLFSRRALRFYAVVAVTLITFVVLFYVEESWRGKRAWVALQREASARGESLEVRSLMTPAIPGDQDFAKAPGVAELLGVTNEPNFGWPFNHGPEQTWPSASWLLEQSTDLAGWQKYFRAHAENSVAAKRGADTLTFPATLEPQTPAADVLVALGKFETNLATLRAASQRPVMRLPLDYGKGFFAIEDMIRPLESLHSAAHLLCLRASAELAQGQSEAALQDVLLAVRLAELVSEEPADYAQRQCRGMAQFCLQPIWEGLAARGWNEEQLALLQNKLAEVDLPAGCRQGLHGDTLGMMSLFDEGLAFVEGRPSEIAQHLQPEDRFGGWVARTFYPVGWFYLDKAWIYRLYQRHSDPFQAAALRNESFNAEAWTITDPIMVIGVLPKLREIFIESSEGSLMIQTFVQQAATACALERFRLAQGQYPDALEALAPKYLQQVPADILAARAATLKYVRAADGGFKLYSVGFSGVDDGGKPNPSIDPHGDILWQLSQGKSDLVWIQPGQH